VSELSTSIVSIASACHRNPWKTLALATLVTAVAFGAASRLTLDTDATRLLPAGAPSALALEQLREAYGGVGFVSVVLRGDDPAFLATTADEIVPALEALPTIRAVHTRQPGPEFGDHAAHFTPIDDLEQLADDLNERWEWEVSRRSPLSVILEDEPPQVRVPERVPNRGPQADRLWGPDQRSLVILARPRDIASDLSFARDVVTDVRGVLNEQSAEVRWELSGRYVKRVDLQDQLEADLSRSGAVALVLIVLALLLRFRSVERIVGAVIPLLVGLVWTYGFAWMMFGTLSVLTGFLAAILLGMGIDTGIHLIEAYEDAQRAGADEGASITAAFSQVGRPALGAAATTLVAFICIAFSSLRAFHEFGALAAAGVALSFLAYLTLLPALIAIGGGTASRRGRGPVRSSRWGVVIVTVGPAVLAVFFTTFPWAASHAGDVGFQYDFSALDGAHLRSYVVDEEVNETLGRSQTPIVILAPGRAAATRAGDSLRAHLLTTDSSTIASVTTLGQFLPAPDAVRMDLLERIATVSEKLLPYADTPEVGADLRRLHDLATQPPPTLATLPSAITENFLPAGPGGPEAVLVSPAVSMSDGRASRLLVREIESVGLGDRASLVIGGEAFVLADVLDTVQDEGPGLLIAAALSVLLVLLVHFRSLTSAALAIFPAVVAIIGTAAAIELGGGAFNYLNILVLPILLGLSVDGGVYIVSHARREPLESAVSATAGPITMGVLTTIAGFGSLALAHHPGLASIGIAASIGLVFGLAACVLTVPALLAATRRIYGVGSSWAQRVSVAISTTGGVGYSRLGPGTLGSLVATPLAFPLATLGWPMRALALVVLSAISFLAVYAMPGRLEEDPQEIVIDEVAGCACALAFVAPSPGWMVVAFVVFRLLDMLKPGPIGWFERHGPHWFRIMADDLAAGLIAGASASSLQLILSR